jgi:hypothetical protein
MHLSDVRYWSHARTLASSVAFAGASVSAFVTAAFWSSPAHATDTDTIVAASLALAAPVQTDQVKAGWGFDGRLGRRLDGKLLKLTGEFVAGYYDFGGDLSPTVYRGMAGARLAIGAVLTPLVFAHAGVARATFSSPPGRDLDRTAFTYDAGGGLDFTLLPLVNLGAYASYNHVASKGAADSLQWLSLGLNAELVF